MTMLRTILTWAPPTLVTLAAIEGAILTWRRKGAYDWRAYGASLVDFLVREYVVYVFLPFSLAEPFIRLAATHPLHLVPRSGGVAFAIIFFGQEFCYYWYHRTAHRVRWFWGSHAVHHSVNELTLGAAYRFGWTGRLSGALLFFVPLIWLGFPPSAVFGVYALNLLYQFWLHTDWIPKLGWLEVVLNTPSHHRVHHSANPEYLDANFGGVLIVFDRLFGTCVVERDDVPCRYGLVHPLTTHNPVKTAFHEWWNIARDLTTARSLREVAGYLFGPPGWRPNGQGMTTAELQANHRLAVVSET